MPQPLLVAAAVAAEVVVAVHAAAAVEVLVPVAQAAAEVLVAVVPRAVVAAQAHSAVAVAQVTAVEARSVEEELNLQHNPALQNRHLEAGSAVAAINRAHLQL